jgi:hypothetical protein
VARRKRARDREWIDIVCAPTPELDELVEVLRSHIAAEPAPPPSYLAAGRSPAQLASLFAAAAALFRTRPWSRDREDRAVFSISIPALDRRDAVLSVFGADDDAVGLVLFRDLDDFETFVDATEALASGFDAPWPPHLRLDFERADAIDPALRAEVAAHGWELAGDDAYPWPVHADGDGVVRPATSDELVALEAIARALPRVERDRPAITAAWRGGEPWTRTERVAVHAAELDVSLRVPPAASDQRVDDRGPDVEDDVLGALAWLADESDGEPDPDRRAALEDRLVDEFLTSPEGASSSNLQAYRLVMDYAASHFGATIATATPAELREILFEIIPAKVSVDAASAAAIVGDVRAFYRFLDRVHGLPQAAACLRVLDGDTVRRMEASLGDRRRFGPAKALLLAGRDAGHDMETQAGVEAWMREVSSRPVPESIWSPPLDVPRPGPPRQPPSNVDKKRKRKAARAARKRNR